MVPGGVARAEAAAPIRLLICDDEPALARSLARLFASEDYEVATVGRGEDALALLAERPMDVVLLDVRMPGLQGPEVLDRIKRSWPEVQVVMMTAFGSIEIAVEAIRNGAYDFLTKPFDPVEQVERAVDRAAEHKRLLDRNRFLEQRLELEGQDYYGIVGSSPPMRAMFDVVEVVRHATSSVLIQGESGTGKELVARALHHGSPRKHRRFVAVNCSALPETLLESELFGHVRGAFTGAVAAKEGLFERADGGTLFLDEIGEMPLSLQVKLLRVLQEGELRRVGGTEARRVDVRVVAATHVDVRKALATGRFREDLYYRLNVIGIDVPPLRERLDDIPVLAHHFLRRHARRNGKRVEHIAPGVLEALATYRWPGNVRELENVMERAVVMSRGDTVELAGLPEQVAGRSGPRSGVAPRSLTTVDFRTAKALAVQSFEERYVREVLDRTERNVSRAARLAGLDRSNFRRLMRRYPEGEGDA